ncbi:DUF2855 family protein [Algoriphagus sp. oki45]|uniref:DUF2855 family protein n=1 Tax=Algoriphagus sp. oki45 TaxID=3067294 RepID=UPI0027FBF491|nr:DUF2855 family protein [Algoriphagus sp. oki45]
MKTLQIFDFLVQRDQLQETLLLERPFTTELSPDQVLLEIQFFSFTSNNITYGVSGDKLGYWSFFPTQEGYGIIPTWGFAKVIDSTHPEVQKGERFYGFFPMSTHLVTSPGRVSQSGFVDQSTHRQQLPGVYNFYFNLANDPSITPESESLISIFRPLFVTSFLIEDHLKSENYFQANQVVLTSASSKTAQVLACLLSNRKKKVSKDLHIIGLTSKENKGFVSSLGWYDQILSYDEIGLLDPEKKHIVIDFTGNHNTQFKLQNLLKEQLVYNCLVGLVDWQGRKGDEKLPQKGEFFFAPTFAEKRQKEWGIDEFHVRLGMAWNHFYDSIRDKIQIQEHLGLASLSELYPDMLLGKMNPAHGHIIRIAP